ncbi:hypothetical protein LB506_006922 [Fusarium annulatum]|nr:hypothetical protein LB506_006922 [Fusarium annulatum]
MGRRDTYSEPPRSHRQSRRQPPPRRGPPVKQSESGFDWTPGIVLALLGAFTWLSHDFDNYKKKHEHCDVRRRMRGEGEGTDRVVGFQMTTMMIMIIGMVGAIVGEGG